jgi:hypothetical protein
MVNSFKDIFKVELGLRLRGHNDNSNNNNKNNRFHLELGLMKEYSYSSTPPLGLRGLLQGEVYLLYGNITHNKESVTI